MCPWVRIDDHLDDDPRIATVGPAGAGLLVLLLVYSNKTLADGFVSDAIVRQKALGLSDADAVIAELARVGLLHSAERGGIAGYQIAADLVAFQPTSESVRERRAQAKARKERWLELHRAATLPKRRLRSARQDDAGNGRPAPQERKRRPAAALVVDFNASPHSESPAVELSKRPVS